MDDRETLTTQEVQTAASAAFDLASGYPQIAIPDYIRDLYLDRRAGAASLTFAPNWSAADQRRVGERLEASLVALLGLHDGSYVSIGATFSGSVAVDRSLAAAMSMLADIPGNTRESRVHVVTTSPSIDIMKFLLMERQPVELHFVESRSRELGGLDREAVLAEVDGIGRSFGFGHLVVLLTSPENPTGAVWSPADLVAIAEACQHNGGVFVIDQSFLLAGVHDSAAVSRAWHVLPTGMDWIALWDTGKTFGLNEDKLGFMICGSVRLSKHVNHALGVMQFDVSRRLKLLFADIFREAAVHDYVGYLRNICRTNLREADKLSNGTWLTVRRLHAGSLALMEFGSSAKDDDEKIRRKLLGRGIGVVSGRVFFHTEWKPDNLIRIALAREPDHFRAAFTGLVRELVRGAGGT